ncbi:hypothetical protein GGH94_001112 [Coemansia aciculifera]|uniref:Uncharacterized protein n=1 Tax=Coemansia aciculifera TaxID=417176 RepID=A0A9W8IRH9_9FUNG|nr:hypothetical protein GGH94_001112 [Coemansia aciculifera]KAJ2876207.1 hypothetical protein GGH93_000951 [Coemansia aciculifera]
MSADADCVSSAAAGTLSATLPRSFRPSSLLRRRLADAEHGPAHNSGLRLSMPMAGDTLDFLDFSAFVNNGGAALGQSAEENMLQALLSSLPEPPAFTATRLGPKVYTPRLTDSLAPISYKPQLTENTIGVPGSAFGHKREPSAQFDTDAGSLATALATPASSRRNTDEVDLPPLHRARLQQQPSVDSLASAASTSDTVSSAQVPELLSAEMPPVSPFFARVSFADIDDARETVRRASLSRRRSRTLADSYDRHAASWCAPSAAPTPATGRLSLAEVARALTDVFTPPPSDELLINQQPPTSPLFTDILPQVCRWFRVNVYGLLTSQTARVTVTELKSPHTLIDISEPAIQKALRQYPLVLALASRQQQKQPASKMPTRMRVPTRRQPNPLISVLSTPTLSFTISTEDTADRPVRSVDVEAMTAAYLPHVHALLNDPDSSDTVLPSEDITLLSDCLRTPSQSSTATLADSLRSEAPTEQAKPAPRSLLRRPQRRSDIGLSTTASIKPESALPMARQQLRASASVMNLRGAYAERASPQSLASAMRRSTTASISQIAAPPRPQQPVSRRRSEVQALITQANAVMSSGLRRSSALDPPATQAPKQLRPPRASFPLYSTPSLSLLRSPGLLSDAAPSGLRTPTALSSSLSAALSRQQHRLEPARSEHLLRHSISSGDMALPLSMLAPVRSINAELLSSAPRIPRGSTPLSGIRPPPPSAPANLSRNSVASQPTPLSRRPTPATPLSSRVSGTTRTSLAGPMSAGSSRLRHSGPSSATLRQAYKASFYESSDSDEYTATSSGLPPRRLTSGSTMRPRARPGVQALFSGNSCDEGFLTLRPVHTPDLVPRTIDPRLIERAMTPMLKTNVGIQYSSLVDLVRSAATINVAEPVDDDDDDDDVDLECLPPHLPTLTEVSPAAEMPQSRFSPINSPERSPALVPVGSAVGGSSKFTKPSFLARYRSAKPSTAPLPVSAIPLPPATPALKTAAPLQPPQSRALGLSNIPTLRKARSLWAMRSTPSQK